MSISRILAIFRKDLAVGPRSPIILFALVMPLLLTLVLNLVFGGLLSAKPRLAIVDAGQSEVTELAIALPGIETTVLSDEADLKRRVETNEFDAGLVLSAEFDRLVRSGEKPELRLFIAGESYAVNRLVLAVTTIDVIREVEGKSPPVNVELVDLGRADPIPLSRRFVPVIAMYAFIIAGLFVPASSIVEERERRTVVAVLTSPANVTEFLCAKGALGIVLTVTMTTITLSLNEALGPAYGSMLAVIMITSVFWALLGLVIGLASKNSETLFAIVKGSGALLMAPVVFYIFPDWPEWIARIFPTYWAIDPLWRIMVDGRTIRDVLGPLAIVVAMSLALIPAIAVLSRKMQKQLATG
ncbi:MAG: ABC transporter permease [Spirochaetaceae bacterium]|nr:MAG: ABC transporter permease [Spirochaetaceae bacterium]